MRPQIITEEQFKEMRTRVGGVTRAEATAGSRSGGERRAAPDLAKRPGHRQLDKLPSSPYAPYANKWELNYSKVLELEQKVGAIKSWKYSGITFNLSYRQYHRIDFIIGHNDRSIEIAQVKGYHPNMRAGIKGLKWAAQLYPMFTWTMKWWTGTGWDGKYVEI